MLSFENCRKLAVDYVARLKTAERLQLSDWFDQSEFCFAFTYNSKEFLSTENPLDMVVGQGPLIVDRRNGAIIETGSGFPKSYLENYEKRGDPYKEAGSIIQIQKVNSGALAINAIKAIRTYSGLGLKGAKEAIEQVLAGGITEIDAQTNEQADALVDELLKANFSAERV